MSARPFVRFDEVKTKVSIPEVLSALGIEGQFVRKSDTLTGACPVKNHRHGPSPNANQFKANKEGDRWVWYCFGDCQRGGSVIDLVMGILGLSEAHVRLWFAEHFSSRLTLGRPKNSVDGEKASDRSQQRKPIVADGHPSTEDLIRPLTFKLNLDQDSHYLRQRGIEESTVSRFDIGMCRRGMLAGYLAIPVFRHPKKPEENPVAYLGRWPSDDPGELGGRSKYRWPEGFAKQSVVYGLSDALESDSQDPLVVVEGVFSVYALFQAGIKSAVAVFGSTVGERQAELLAGTRRKLAILFDSDESGRRGAQNAVKLLAPQAFVRTISLPDGCQPDQLTGEELRSLLP